jgi:hypothetical protein
MQVQRERVVAVEESSKSDCVGMTEMDQAVNLSGSQVDT